MIIARLAAAMLLVTIAHAAQAQAVSPWSSDAGARLRLIAGAPAADGRMRAGIEIRLEPNWKTYWKNPGPSGLPPEFDWSESVNVAAVDVAFPAPRRFADGVDAAGYSGTVVLPLKVTAIDPDEPVILALAARYGVCEKICVPAAADARLDLALGGAVDPLSAAQLAGFEQRVPAQAAVGDTGEITVKATRLAEDRKTLVVELTAAPGAQSIDLFADASGALKTGLPRRMAGDPLRFEVPVKPARRAGPPVVELVAVADARAIDVRLPLDLALARP